MKSRNKKLMKYLRIRKILDDKMTEDGSIKVANFLTKT